MKIMPFQGVLYNTKKVDLSQVVTLPYDKISPQLKEQYLARNAYSAARIILPNTNQESSDLWQKWLVEDILIQDSDPTIYLYQEQYEYPKGTARTRTGIVALLDVQPYGQDTVMPHEKTFAKVRAAREDLLKTCQANFGHIFMLYSDQEKQAEEIIAKTIKNKPRMEYRDDAGVIHRIWSITDKDLIKQLQSFFINQRLFIADGHHRYGAALDYKEKQKKIAGDKYTGREGFNYRMATLVNVDDPGVTILPTHRVIKELKQVNSEQIIKELEKYFFVTKDTIPSSEMITPWLTSISGEHVFGMYFGGSDYYKLNLKPGVSLADVLGLTRPQTWLNLDVNILHLLIFKHVLNVDTSNHKDEANILYIRDPYEAIDWVRKNNAGLACILNPTKVSEVKEIVSLAEVMPHKSTDFYPKLNTGLVMRKLEEVADCDVAKKI